MVYNKEVRPLHVVVLIVFVRLLSVFVVQTWYEADEYWQSLEVAHKEVFGYGELTWEWKKGIRSYIYPHLIADLYAGLKYTHLDYPEAVVLVPRIFQALVSAFSDYRFYKWTKERKWSLFLVLTSWFWFYAGSRTLLQTMETAIVTFALSLFPFKGGLVKTDAIESSSWIFLAGVSVFLRPTSAPIWLVLTAYQLLTTNQRRLPLIIRTYVPICAITASILIGIDSYHYGKLTVTPWEFFRFNILHDVASHYGTHPWHWYLSQGIPAVLGINLLPLLYAVYTILRRPKENTVGVVLLAAAAFHVLVHSFVPHKEFRFVLPILPIFLYLIQDVIVQWSRKAKKWQLYFVALVILIANAVPAVYLGQVHQAGTTGVMPLLRDAIPNNRSSILFMTPCHATPAYSHLHINVTTRFLNCDPPFDKIGETYESEYFFNNPQRWWRSEYTNKQTPTFIVMFDTLKGRVESLLGGYKQIHSVSHTQFPSGEIGQNVLVFQKDVLKALRRYSKSCQDHVLVLAKLLDTQIWPGNWKASSLVRNCIAISLLLLTYCTFLLHALEEDAHSYSSAIGKQFC